MYFPRVGIVSFTILQCWALPTSFRRLVLSGFIARTELADVVSWLFSMEDLRLALVFPFSFTGPALSGTCFGHSLSEPNLVPWLLVPNKCRATIPLTPL